MLPSVYTSCQESQTNRDLLLKGLPSAEPLNAVTCLRQVGRRPLRGGAWQGEPPEPCGQGCFGTWAGTTLPAEPGRAPGGAASSHSSTGEAQLPHGPAHKQLLCQPSPWSTEEEEALQPQENSKLWNRTSRDRPASQEQVSIGLWCWLASACRVLPGCCRDRDWGQHHSLCLFSFPLCIFGVIFKDLQLVWPPKTGMGKSACSRPKAWQKRAKLAGVHFAIPANIRIICLQFPHLEMFYSLLILH